mmetsp:Transcript_51400/g.61861  ORF Transcript_51400/g.61861 Transcript_51400/m.61861 type:complete len:112 (+) Transcript_51400:731-1066(+)
MECSETRLRRRKCAIILVESAWTIAKLSKELETYKRAVPCLKKEMIALQDHVQCTNPWVEKSKLAISHLQNESQLQSRTHEETLAEAKQIQKQTASSLRMDISMDELIQGH